MNAKAFKVYLSSFFKRKKEKKNPNIWELRATKTLLPDLIYIIKIMVSIYICM
jgi:hypothetical protein